MLERAVPLAFHLCCFYFRLVFRAGCGIRLYRFLIIAFLSAFKNLNNTDSIRSEISSISIFFLLLKYGFLVTFQ